MWLPLTGQDRRQQPTKGLTFTRSAIAFRLDTRRQGQFQISGFKRILVFTQRWIVRGCRNSEAGRQARIQEARPLQLVETGQIAKCLEAELRQERVRGSKRQRPARCLAPSTRT